MHHIMNPIKQIVLTLTLLLTYSLTAQEICIKAPSTISVGVPFHVSFEVNAKSNKFQGPTFKGLSVLSGPSTSSSSSYSWINGQTTSSVTTKYDYLVQADQEGTFTIGPATCTVDGKKISSESFSIKVTKADPKSSANQRQNHGQYGDPYGRQQANEPQVIDETTLFAKASVTNSTPYQGEQIIISYKIYTQIPISRFQIEKLPGNKGFWSEDLSANRSEVKQWEETLNGKRYQVAEIRRGALFAQESGKLEISPIDLDVLAMIQRQRRRTGTIFDLFDDPFFSSSQAVEKHLRTSPLTIKVKPLPTPAEGFTGGVGTFNIKAETDLTEVKANEAITYKLTISGQGNLMLITPPTINFSKAFEVYDPEISDNIKHTDNGISGSRTFEWVLIPRAEGKYTLDGATLTYFDPETKKYITKTTQPISLKINRGDPRALKGQVSAKGDIQHLNKDINYNKKNTNTLKPIISNKTEWWFWAVLFVIAIGCTTVAIFRKRQEEQEKDIAGTRLKRATKEARKRLKRAEKHLNSGEEEAFYIEIYRSIWGVLSDKFNIELSKLSSETVEHCLTEKQVKEDERKRILDLLHEVDFARFAPGDSSEKKQHIYNEALNLIATL